ncbi:MAG: hypothetical protein QNL62_19365 [Gammaproteobacteria bacterium]|nr:hypothetical protein [Gammaproteobacteria bacterium]
MNSYFIVAGCLTLVLGIIHSVLGEILIFHRLRKGNLISSAESPILTERHMRTLRAAWHLVTLFGWGFAGILLRLSWPASSNNHLAFAEGTMVFMFLTTSLYWFIGTRGKHPAWIVLLIIGVLVWLA